jgi:predicted Na+-dependent transporter
LYGNKHQDVSGVLSLPLIIYHVEQLIIGAIEVILLKNWVKKE